MKAPTYAAPKPGRRKRARLHRLRESWEAAEEPNVSAVHDAEPSDRARIQAQKRPGPAEPTARGGGSDQP